MMSLVNSKAQVTPEEAAQRNEWKWWYFVSPSNGCVKKDPWGRSVMEELRLLIVPLWKTK